MTTYFCKVRENLTNKIKITVKKKVKLPPINTNIIFVKPTDKFKVQKIIDNTKIKKEE